LLDPIEGMLPAGYSSTFSKISASCAAAKRGRRRAGAKKLSSGAAEGFARRALAHSAR
jgi:hypothetical protein